MKGPGPPGATGFTVLLSTCDELLRCLVSFGERFAADEVPQTTCWRGEALKRWAFSAIPRWRWRFDRGAET